MAQFCQWGHHTITFDISVIDVAMLIAIAVLFALCLTGLQRENNRQKPIIKAQRILKEPRRQTISQETVNQEKSDCPHKFGFLKTQKTRIVPEECMGCAVLVKCMLPDE